MTESDEARMGAAAHHFPRSVVEGCGDLVAVGGGLEPDLVLEAYRHGVFPWFGAGERPLWWSPDPRAILPLDALHVSRRLARTLRGGSHHVTRDEDFEAVMRACDQERPDGSWIHGDMVRCYAELHSRGHAHSVEVRREGHLVGGIYGVAVGAAFAAESMFHRARDASKVALVHLVRHLVQRGFILLDVQFLTPHLEKLGCVEIARSEYLDRVEAARDLPVTWDDA